jgi:hypothetical protein
VVVLDSHYDTVVRLEPWGPLVRRLAYRAPRGTWLRRLPVYDLHPLSVRGETGLRLTLTPPRARCVLDAPAEVRGALDTYAQRLAPFAARNGHHSGAVALASWLTAHQRDLGLRMARDGRPFALAAEVFASGDTAGLRTARVVREGGRNWLSRSPTSENSPEARRGLLADFAFQNWKAPAPGLPITNLWPVGAAAKTGRTLLPPVESESRAQEAR